jgi:hypothetical protein
MHLHVCACACAWFPRLHKLWHILRAVATWSPSPMNGTWSPSPMVISSDNKFFFSFVCSWLQFFGCRRQSTGPARCNGGRRRPAMGSGNIPPHGGGLRAGERRAWSSSLAGTHMMDWIRTCLRVHESCFTCSGFASTIYIELTMPAILPSAWSFCGCVL